MVRYHAGFGIDECAGLFDGRHGVDVRWLEGGAQLDAGYRRSSHEALWAISLELAHVTGHDGEDGDAFVLSPEWMSLFKELEIRAKLDKWYITQGRNFVNGANRVEWVSQEPSSAIPVLTL